MDRVGGAARAALQRLVRPVVSRNQVLYGWFNQRSAALLRARGDRLVPPGITANRITTARSMLVVPTLFLYSGGHTITPALCVVANVTFDYVDGAVARWEQAKKRERMMQGDAARLLGAGHESEPLVSANQRRLQETWGAYYDAIADKAFAIPVWMCLFQHSSGDMLLQTALLAHATIEGYSSYVRTKAYFTEPSSAVWLGRADAVAADPNAAKTDRPRSAVVAGIVGKTKQFMAMIGTALVMIPVTKPIGTVLIVASVPLAIGSVLQKMRSTTVYAEVAADQPLGPQVFEFLAKARALGSSLTVGIRSDTSDDATLQLADTLLLHPQVDHVLHGASLPPLRSIADESFLRRFSIDIVAVPSSQTFENIDLDPAHFQGGIIVPVKLDL